MSTPTSLTPPSRVPFLDHSYYSTPQRRTTFSPRVDYALGANHTLSFRYSYLNNERVLTFGGATNLPETTLGDFTLPSTGYTSAATDNSVQIVETSVLSPKAINETHINIEKDYTNLTSQSNVPTLSVVGSFVAGGSGQTAPGYGANSDNEKQQELQNYTSLTLGTHTVKFGIRIRSYMFTDVTPSNFNGTYSFLGSTVNYNDIAACPVPLRSFPAPMAPSPSHHSSSSTLRSKLLLAGQQLSTGLGPTQYSVTTATPISAFIKWISARSFKTIGRFAPISPSTLACVWRRKTTSPLTVVWRRASASLVSRRKSQRNSPPNISSVPRRLGYLLRPFRHIRR